MPQQADTPLKPYKFKPSKIDDLIIKIEEYRRPINDSNLTNNNQTESQFPYFVGRKSVIRKLKDLLSGPGGKGGAYLLVGARGMGKTTVINKVLHELEIEGQPYNKHYNKINISLSNENFEEIDVYRIIGKTFLKKFLEKNQFRFSEKKNFKYRMLIILLSSVLIWTFLSFFLYLNSLSLNPKWSIPIDPKIFNSFIFYFSQLTILTTLSTLAFLGFRTIKNRELLSLRWKINSFLKRIDAEVAQENTSSISKFLTIGQKTTYKYPIADIRFIEFELIELIKSINSFNSSKMKNIQYVFVFDELDKIEPTSSSLSLEQVILDEQEENNTRRKQKAVFDILGNFKYFLKEAEAKFLFIAGREMTDASMADISKRNFYLRSIFDEIIHLGSLLKEDIKTIDLRIASAIEVYVYGILSQEESFLNGDSNILISEKNNDNLEKYSFEKIIEHNPHIEQKEAKEKYKCFLKDFILYLTYRSHGAPKLLYQYFEGYISTGDIEDENEDIYSGHFLRFTYNQQVVIGFVANMYRNLVINKYNTTIGSSDKLLTTLPFLLDHILKFHNFAFSGRSLELLPEVIDVNKAPNLRIHINNIVDHLRSSEVNEISNGLFEYKFHKSSSSEIRYISEISKTSRAAFNFTLDESFPLKRTFKRRIDKLNSTPNISANDNTYIHSLGFYYMILGDLHFYDKEYDQAIENYNHTVQSFRSKSIHDNTINRLRSHEFIIYVRGMLKLTLTYERMKDYDLIFTYLERINRHIFDFFNFDKEQKVEGLEDLRLKSILELKDYRESQLFQFNNQWIFTGGLINVLYLTEKASSQGVTTEDIELSTTRFLTIVKNKIHPKENNSNGYDKEYARIWYYSMLKAQFFNHIGDLLFYKNGFIPGTKLKSNHQSKDLAENFYDEIINEWELGNTLPKYLNIPISAYSYYFECLSGLLKDSKLRFSRQLDFLLGSRQSFEELERKEQELYLVIRYYQYLNSDERLFPHNYQSKLFLLVAGYIADFANEILCLSSSENVNNNSIIKFLTEISPEQHTPEIKLDSLVLKMKGEFLKSPLLRFSFFTYLSGLYYRRINKQKEYAGALTKILYVLKYNYSLYSDKNILPYHRGVTSNELDLVFSTLFFPSFKTMRRVADFKYFKPFLDISNLDEFLQIDLTEITRYPEIKELVIVMLELVLTCSSEDDKYWQLIKSRDWIDRNTVVRNNWSRTLELRYKVKFNFRVLQDDHTPGEKNLIIADSIWCLKKIRTNLQVYGISHITNYFFRAEAHDHLASLCKMIEDHDLSTISNTLINPDKKENNVNESGYFVSMNSDRLDKLLNQKHHIREALNNYRSTIQLHSQGSCYHEVIREMYFLEGDFDDQTSHFCAALDRYRMNTGYIASRIELLEKGSVNAAESNEINETIF